MTIVKSLQFRKNLKSTLLKSYDEEVMIDYYGELFQIVPVKKNPKKQTQTQKIIAKYSTLKPVKITDPVFNEADPAQEKANIRDLMYGTYE